MCGRYCWAQKKKLTPPKNLILPSPPSSVSYNRAPGQDHPIIIRGNKECTWSLAKWGLIPEQKEGNAIPHPINARIETVREKPIFQNSVQQRRCLIPADGYFEWQKLETQKYPHFHFLNKQDTFAMAGIWNETKRGRPNGSVFYNTYPFSVTQFTSHPSPYACHSSTERLDSMARFTNRSRSVFKPLCSMPSNLRSVPSKFAGQQSPA